MGEQLMMVLCIVTMTAATVAGVVSHQNQQEEAPYVYATVDGMAHQKKWPYTLTLILKTDKEYHSVRTDGDISTIYRTMLKLGDRVKFKFHNFVRKPALGYWADDVEDIIKVVKERREY